MVMYIGAIIVGLFILVWSAEKFVAGASSISKILGMPPLLIGMIVVGFGTSAPEMVVSTISALQDSPGLALGNAYGSNITNIALILGITALISPITVQSSVIKKELPLLILITCGLYFILNDFQISFTEAMIHLVLFAGLLLWSIIEAKFLKKDAIASDIENELEEINWSVSKSLFWLFLGLALLIASSRLLVWGAVFIAQSFGVSDLIIGLTIIAIGTSLPELASSVAAAKKGEHDLALGNIIGSNLFNTLAVVGIAGAIKPFSVESDIFTRDWPVMIGLTLMLFVMAFGIRQRAKILRIEGFLLLCSYLAYVFYLIYTINA